MSIGKRWCNAQQVPSRWRISLRRSFYEIHPTSSRRRSSPSGTFGLPAKRMGMLASSYQDVTHRIKEKMWGTCLPGRPRERGRTSQDMITCHLCLMMRMKWTQGMSHSRMKLGEVRSPTKGKGKSANPKGDNNTVGMQMDDPDPDEGS